MPPTPEELEVGVALYGWRVLTKLASGEYSIGKARAMLRMVMGESKVERLLHGLGQALEGQTWGG